MLAGSIPDKIYYSTFKLDNNTIYTFSTSPKYAPYYYINNKPQKLRIVFTKKNQPLIEFDQCMMRPNDRDILYILQNSGGISKNGLVKNQFYFCVRQDYIGFVLYDSEEFRRFQVSEKINRNNYITENDIVPGNVVIMKTNKRLFIGKFKAFYSGYRKEKKGKITNLFVWQDLQSNEIITTQNMVKCIKDNITMNPPLIKDIIKAEATKAYSSRIYSLFRNPILNIIS